MNADARTQLAFEMLTLTKKIPILLEPVFKNMRQQMSGPDNWNV